MSSIGSSYWCYRCNRISRIRTRIQDAIICPDCNSGFIEQIDTPNRPLHQRFPPAELYFDGNHNPETFTSTRFSRTRSNGGDRSPFNPVIVLRGPQTPDSGGGNNENATERGNFELYYDDGTGAGLRPLPTSMSEFLMGSGFDRILDQLSQLEFNGVTTRYMNPPASKAAIESMPVVRIAESHVAKESHCAVCKEPLELNTEAREMPCKHIYHAECILPWLSMRNSCPLCRLELPNEPNDRGINFGGPEETVGLTIWRLPGGGFAIGRFNGGRRAAEREFPVVFTEMDGGFNAGSGAPRRISWVHSGRRARESNGFTRAFRGFTSLLRRIRLPSSQATAEFNRRSPFLDVIYGRSSATATANYFSQFHMGENRLY